MEHVTQQIDIAAPLDKTFAFVADRPERATAFIPGLNRIEAVTPAEAAPGQTWTYEFNWFGLVVAGNSRCVELERPRRYSFETESPASTWAYGFETHGGGTRVTLTVDFEVPHNQVARFAAAGALQKMNEERAAEALANLKQMLEE
jgi:carbon monoxide dehydrogenase subunit G